MAGRQEEAHQNRGGWDLDQDKHVASPWDHSDLDLRGDPGGLTGLSEGWVTLAYHPVPWPHHTVPYML